MGAGQSSTGGAGESGGGGEVKTSYYELLGAERSATQDELKKAYRKKALELHPDRNHGDVERTTALFAEIQTAYQVLSDEQERAWYDAHEGDILRGGSGEGATEDHYQGNMRMTTEDDLIRMMGKFRGKVDYSDSPNGFFGFVRETFEELAKEEKYAADYDDVDVPDYPTFGHKDDSHDDVVRAFYSAWSSFATVKSYAWLDVYRLSDAPDRRTRRLAEKENQKCRDDGRRKFSEAVRTLVAFVRKRDPRYKPDTQSAEEKAKAHRTAIKEQAARARAAQQAKLDEEARALPNWATVRPADEEDEETEEEIEEEHYECVACNKTFKSERQYEAHERSKKHQKAIQSLKRKMQKDNANLNLDEDVLTSGVITPVRDSFTANDTTSDTNGIDDSIEDLTKKTEDLQMEEISTDDEEGVNKHSDVPTKLRVGNHDEPEDEEKEDEDEDEDEYAPRSTIEVRPNGLTSTQASTDPSTAKNKLPSDLPTEEDLAPQGPKIGKAAQKRAKKAAKEADAVSSAGTSHNCLGCGAAFSSKTQLHQHLQDHPKHAASKSISNEKGKKKGKR
ncbi:hypothetical protein GQ44DRAFT_617699 [Phaeosphaeriaceae sp. PMI808]|nr:hypothetical protein GQ44DRAFT_617699 [Phaeosphaeriaceae sp. PMI808]